MAKKNYATKNLDIYQETGDITGTNTAGQGPTPYQTPKQQLAMDTNLHPFKSDLGEPRTGKDCIDIHELGYDYSKGSLDDSYVSASSANCQICSHDVNSLQECEELLAKEYKSHPEVPLRVFFDITKAKDDFEKPWWIDTPLLMNLGEKKIQFKSKEWKRKFFIKVKNLDKDENIGSFVVQAFYKKDEKLFFIGQRGILSRWQRKDCANCRVRNKASVGIFVSNEMTENVFKSNNLVVHILKKDPERGDSVIKNIEMEWEDASKPQILKIALFERDI